MNQNKTNSKVTYGEKKLKSAFPFFQSLAQLLPFTQPGTFRKSGLISQVLKPTFLSKK